MNDAENDPRLSKATREQLVAARQAVWDQYMNLPDDYDEPVKAPPPKGRFADPARLVK